MKFQNPSLNSVLNGLKDERTSRKQYAPHFFKVGGINRSSKSYPCNNYTTKTLTSETAQMHCEADHCLCCSNSLKADFLLMRHFVHFFYVL